MAFFVAVGTLCGICGVLAALLVLADRYLNDYGACTLTINDGRKTLEVPGGSSLLSALNAERIFIPSACGGGGSCGLCKLKVLSGGGPVLATETPHLSDAEVRSGVRLSCQLKVREDMRLEIPEAFFRIREYRARLEAKTPLTHDIVLLRLELLEPGTMAFTPGEYVQLQAPAYARSPTPVYRAYSLAGDPGDEHHIELIVRLVPNGICTTWVFEHLRVGDTVHCNGPHGEFRLTDTDREMLFIAGGSGMAPFRSMLAQMAHTGSQRRCRYFFGAVERRGMFCLDEMREYERVLPAFRFIPALSAPAEGDAWEGETGLITDVVNRHCPDCSNLEGYLCGSPGMIDACVRVLTGNGMPEEQIFYDKFA
ncbi:MAG: 2Fe-2S iron-sulfur cluster binding domain-containing protein [Lentisphaeria bacterium]|nr:2Fe-2S iron-sulfur cluster binding domain-containing protein [Lentisphaeria bacterium]